MWYDPIVTKWVLRKFANDHGLGYMYPFFPAADQGSLLVHEGVLSKTCRKAILSGMVSGGEVWRLRHGAHTCTQSTRSESELPFPSQGASSSTTLGLSLNLIAVMNVRGRLCLAHQWSPFSIFSFSLAVVSGFSERRKVSLLLGKLSWKMCYLKEGELGFEKYCDDPVRDKNTKAKRCVMIKFLWEKRELIFGG